jgi:hypothetical protein
MPKRPNGRYSGVEPTGTPAAVDRALKKNSRDDMRGYDTDAHAIAKVLVRHYGDEADAVLKRTLELLGDARRTKR